MTKDNTLNETLGNAIIVLPNGERITKKENFERFLKWKKSLDKLKGAEHENMQKNTIP